MTYIFPCSCKHEFQDRVYGPGKRLHNPCKNGYRCTVCGHVRLEYARYKTPQKSQQGAKK